MVKVTLTFSVPDDVLPKLIPSVRLYATISTVQGIVEIVNDPPGPGVVAEGTNGLPTARNIE